MTMLKLGSLFKSEFYKKCKKNIKRVKTRLEDIKKRKNVEKKILTNDIADLLRKGYDMNAYGRAEGLLKEQNVVCYYELIDNFCGTISSNLSLMEKQEECPEKCKEAVASLIYAAARVANLYELKELRKIFTKKYKNSLEAYTNQELIEKLSPMTFAKEMKLQLFQDIANENSIEWDSKALEQQLFTPPTIQDEANVKHYYNIINHHPPNSSKNDVEDDDDYSSSTVTDFSQDGSVTEEQTVDIRPTPDQNPTGLGRREKENWSTSLPLEATRAELGETRAASFQPDRGHIIHPRLPEDYAELAARVATLSGK